jgi:hypothetical protein
MKYVANCQHFQVVKALLPEILALEGFEVENLFAQYSRLTYGLQSRNFTFQLR